MNTANPVILLVDDSEEILDYLSQDLTGKYEVRTAMDGLEALDILQHQPIHLVISDVVMPGMDGLALCSAVKSSPDLNHIPVILLTAQNALQSKIQGLKTGADAYIEKPFSLDHLYAQIDNLLENRLKLKESYARSPFLPINSTTYSKEDEVFWKQLTGVILDNLRDTALDVERIAVLLNMSKSTLYRKIKSLSGMSPSDVINLARLKKSADLMSAGNFRINELAREVGYKYPSQFRRNFQKQFKMSPADYIEKVRRAISI
ncbi:DNA-binding response regulator [Paraflavitalea soli]|uniref:DNA-binding response regulator n=1 Tax=Paraflavitalea soli TaxID=2315862 RepID=A0A3B7MNW2_9BACT|nr:response regulator [Paraflavitalea soli]AXY74666.1 DNA-binding response regulator [Paraflavitalea soli]